MLIDKHSSLVQTKLHDRTIIIGAGNYLSSDIWLFDTVDERRSRKSRRVVDIQTLALSCIYFI